MSCLRKLVFQQKKQGNRLCSWYSHILLCIPSPRGSWSYRRVKWTLKNPVPALSGRYHTPSFEWDLQGATHAVNQGSMYSVFSPVARKYGSTNKSIEVGKETLVFHPKLYFKNVYLSFLELSWFRGCSTEKEFSHRGTQSCFQWIGCEDCHLEF